MPRRVPSSHRRISSTPDNNNPYQGTTVAVPINNHVHQNVPQQFNTKDVRKYHYNRNGYQNATTIDTGLSDATFTESESYYDYYQEQGYRHNRQRGSRDTQYSFSDDSGSTRLPLYDDDVSFRRFSRNTLSDRSFVRPHYVNIDSNNHTGHKDVRRIYPNPGYDVGWDRLYQEIPSPCDDVAVPITNNASRPVVASRSSDRPQSSVGSSSAAVIDACGGKCQTFENICYFFLQLVFAMGILVGLSLCLAAAVLRKSAARNLQVLVYIGVLVSLVCILLLGIQCNARNNARKRKNALRNAKRAPIPMETLTSRNNNPVQQPLVIVQQQDGSQRTVQLPQVHGTIPRPLPHRPQSAHSPVMFEEPGIPWWRRKDLNK